MAKSEFQCSGEYLDSIHIDQTHRQNAVRADFSPSAIPYFCNMNHYAIRGLLAFTLLLSILMPAASQQGADAEIRQLLRSQQDSWNAGNIDEFMAGYLNSDALHFLGKSGLTAGWQETLDRYKERYPDTETMGKLRFDLDEITRRTKDVYTVVGQYFLSREHKEDLDGRFLLVVQRIKKEWKIVADSTH